MNHSGIHLKAKHKAFIGDALLQFIVAELLIPNGHPAYEVQRIVSNKNLAKATKKIYPELEKRGIRYLGNKYEAGLYEIYELGGIAEAKEFVKNTLLKEILEP